MGKRKKEFRRALDGAINGFALLVILWQVFYFLFPSSGLISESAACGEKFDVVYTWVNGSDPDFLSQMHQHSSTSSPILNRRFHDHNELRYSLRSLEKHAPWVGKIFLVTNGQVPYWLNTSRVTVVHHQDIFYDARHLPTFSSPAIEANLFRIPGLSNHFLYFNDDVFLGADVFPEDFISANTRTQKVYLSWELPDCAVGCSESFLGDKFCDLSCNVSSCEFDLGDCANGVGKNQEELEIEEEESSITPKDNVCGSEGCVLNWLGDGICDVACRSLECGFDAGDCQKDSLQLFSRYHVDENVSLPNSLAAGFSFLLQGIQVVRFQDQSHLVRLIVPVKRWNASVVLLVASPDRLLLPTRVFVSDVSRGNSFHSFLLVKQNALSVESGPVMEVMVEEQDLFAHSLVFTKRLLKKHLKSEGVNSKVPAHMPHLIDKRIFSKLFDELEEFWKETSSHKFRSARDVQFSYAYFTYLLGQDDQLDSHRSAWDTVDTDKDGCLNANEFRTLVVMILSEDAFYVTKPDLVDLFEEMNEEEEFGFQMVDAEILLLAHDEIWSHSRFSIDPCLNLQVFQRATRAFDAANRNALKTRQRTKSRTEIVQDSSVHVSFAHLEDDPQAVLRTLDALRARPTKFICINDDTTPHQNAKQAQQVDRALQSYFEALFPFPSSFERTSNNDENMAEPSIIPTIPVVQWVAHHMLIFLSIFVPLGMCFKLFHIRSPHRKFM